MDDSDDEILAMEREIFGESSLIDPGTSHKTQHRDIYEKGSQDGINGRIKTRKGKSGRGALHWTYYEEFDVVYGSRHDIDAPTQIIFDSTSNSISHIEKENNAQHQEDNDLPRKKRRKTDGSNSELLKYFKEEDEKEECRHRERISMEEKRNEIEKEKNLIEKEKN